MSNKVHSFLVIFEENIHIDDAEKISSAIKMIKGVLSVKENRLEHGFEYVIAERRTKGKIAHQLMEIAQQLTEETLS